MKISTSAQNSGVILSSIKSGSNNNPQIHFTSDLVGNRYLKAGFACVKRRNSLESLLAFTKAVGGILKDGKKDIVRIAPANGIAFDKGIARPQFLFVNGQKVKRNEFDLGEIFDGPQCVEGIKDFAETTTKKVRTRPLENKIARLEAQLENAKIQLEKSVRKELKGYEKQIFSGNK